MNFIENLHQNTFKTLAKRFECVHNCIQATPFTAMPTATRPATVTARVLESKSCPGTTWIIWASGQIAAADYCRSRYGDDTFRIHNWRGWRADNA